MLLNFKTFIAFITTALLFTSCEGTDDLQTDPMPMVVEGWISEGETPVVMITRAIDLTADSPSTDNTVEKWCRVSVYDNGVRHVLAGKLNDSYKPSYIYTDSRLKGRAGHTYRLEIECRDETYTTEQILLPSPKIARIEPRKADDSDTLYTLQLFLKDLPAGGHYRVFTRTFGSENRFFGSFLGSGDYDTYDPEAGISITRGIHSGYSDTHFDHFFHSGETVMVQVCGVDAAIHTFWQAYDRNVSLSQNLFFTFAENCPGNIPGALGYWAAYGTSTGAVRIP